MVTFLERNTMLHELASLVSARNPFRRCSVALSTPIANSDELSDAGGDVEPGSAGIPVLLRQYLKLGGRLVGFNVDPAFSEALDGLMIVDLTHS
jgi:hypothetical protein